jgi:hypothetical protein
MQKDISRRYDYFPLSLLLACFQTSDMKLSFFFRIWWEKNPGQLYSFITEAKYAGRLFH